MAVDALARALAAGKVPVNAYQMAVAGGYTGTKEEFEEDMGNSATNATNAANSASAAATSATAAATAAANLAPTYSSSATYAVGDHVLYNGGYYVCNSAITTAEAWTAAHWTAVKVGPEITALKNAINTLRETGFIAVPITMENHGITEGTGADNTNSNYIRTKGFVTLDGLVTFVKKANSIAYIYTYDSQGNFEGPPKYLNASTNTYQFTALATKKYRASFGNSPLETINDFNGDEFAFYQSKDEFARKQDVSDIQDDVDELTDTINGETILLSDSFVRGDWEISSGKMVYKPNHSWRVTTDQYVTYDRNITFTIDSGFRVYFTMVDTSYNRTDNSGWVTGEYTVEPYINYLPIIAKTEEDTSVSADITEFSQAVHSKDPSLTERINAIEAKEEKSYFDIKWNEEYYDGHTIRRCYNPYKNGGNNVYVGQLHCHTVGTGSVEEQYATPDELCAIYKNNGYDFMTITDYGFITTYGGKSAHPTTVPTDFLWLTDSQEISIPSGRGRAIKHMCVYNAEDGITFESYASIQEVVDYLTPHGYIVSLAHPMWSHTYLTPAQIKADTKFGLRFVEVYDGLTHSGGEEVYPSGMSTDFAWQTLLDSKVYPWGIAISDSHPISNSDIVNGCVKVFADALTRTNIMKNLCEGNFYASTNVSASLTGIDFTDGVLTVNTGDNSATTTFMKENGTVVKTVTGGTASYSLSGNEQYVRAVVELQSGEKIWTQPIINIIDDEYGYYN